MGLNFFFPYFLEGIFVDELKHESSDDLPKDNQNLKDVSVRELKTSTGPENDYPKNYRTCLDFLQFFSVGW